MFNWFKKQKPLPPQKYDYSPNWIIIPGWFTKDNIPTFGVKLYHEVEYRYYKDGEILNHYIDPIGLFDDPHDLFLFILSARCGSLDYNDKLKQLYNRNKEVLKLYDDERIFEQGSNVCCNIYVEWPYFVDRKYIDMDYRPKEKDFEIREDVWWHRISFRVVDESLIIDAWIMADKYYKKCKKEYNEKHNRACEFIPEKMLSLF